MSVYFENPKPEPAVFNDDGFCIIQFIKYDHDKAVNPYPTEDFDLQSLTGNDLIAIGEKLNELNGVKND